jgi:hypothetical protein
VPNGLLAGHGIEEILEDMATVAAGKLIQLSRQRKALEAQGCAGRPGRHLTVRPTIGRKEPDV